MIFFSLFLIGWEVILVYNLSVLDPIPNRRLEKGASSTVRQKNKTTHLERCI